MEQQQTDTAAARYSRMEKKRQPFLDRARDVSALTIPSLIPPSGHNGSSNLPTPYQGVGAEGVNNLSNKLILTLLPPNTPFFRLGISDFDLEQLTQASDMRGEFEAAMSKIERAIGGEIEATAIRVDTFEAFQHLLVAGNVLLHFPDKGGMRTIHLDKYVVARDSEGNLLEAITKESIAVVSLPELVREAIKGENKDDISREVDLYTHIRRTATEWEVYQEVKGLEVPGTYGTYPLDKLPWFALRWTKITGEDYGRSHGEATLGDLMSLESLTEALVKGTSAAAKVLILVNPGGVTDEREVAEADNGAVIPGRKDDVQAFQLDKFYDFRTAQTQAERIEARLSRAYLLNSSVQRKGERVTAEEIRYVAGELEAALGGVYSLLAQEFQLPLVSQIMNRMQKAGRLPKLPKDTVRPSVTTGVEALGRGNDAQKLGGFIGTLAQLSPNALARIHEGELVKRLAASWGIETAGLVKSDQEIQAEQQQAMMMQTGQQLAPEAMKMIAAQQQQQ